MATTFPSFAASRADMLLINKVANRAVKMAADQGFDYDKMDADMDITACHCNGTPLDLPKLLAAPDGDFGHDVFGIRRFIDRSTGQLTQCFVPRCAGR